MQSLQCQVHSKLKQHAYLVPFLKTFNHLQFSINGNKGYHTSTCGMIQTGMHCDVTYSFSKDEGIHCSPSMNSQEVNTIVAIITIGHPRVITFERVIWREGPTDVVVEKKYFILSHGSLFILHPLDERPALRDKNDNTTLTYWKHGGVRMMCNNQTCDNRCGPMCTAANKNICSFSLGLRCCTHNRTVDVETWVDPLSDNDRHKFNLSELTRSQKDWNIKASSMLLEYSESGEESTFEDWLLCATQQVCADYYYNKD